jgi:hypothetical protein
MIHVECGKCGMSYETKKYYKVDHKGLAEKRMFYVSYCEGCQERIETENGPKRGQVSYGQTPEKATQRILGTNNYWPGRARWDAAPADLVQVLEEEKRLREANSKKEESNEQQGEGSSREGVDRS